MEPTISAYEPAATRLKQKNLHKCRICKTPLIPGERVMTFMVNKVYSNTVCDYAHFNCWYNKHAGLKEILTLGAGGEK